MRTVILVMAISAGVGVLAQTPGADVHYVPTPDAVVTAMLDTAQVTAADVVYDLGSGDGRIVIEAARKYGARAVGIELDPELNRTAMKNARKAGVTDKVRFVRAVCGVSPDTGNSSTASECTISVATSDWT